jgi:signal transduction histidine kinase
MSLRTKFAVLLGLLAVAVCLAIGSSWWAMTTMRREVRQPLEDMLGLLAHLSRARQSAGELAAAPDPTAARAALGQLNASLNAAAASPWAATRPASAAMANLRQRVNDAAALAAPGGDPADRAALALAALQARGLLERMEARLVADTQAALGFSADLERRLTLVLALCLLIGVLSVLLGLSLVRRWVLAPVAALRVAAERLGTGDFAHRVLAPPGTSRRDELVRLGDEINAMAALIKTMQDQRVDRERLAAVGEMVRRLAHNLRNPLGGIRSLAELTRSDLRAIGPGADDLTENQDRIIAAVDRFEAWLNELLSVTRPMQVLPSPTPVPLFLQGLVDAHLPQARSRGVDLTLDLTRAPDQATFDPRHLQHALSAVLSNAIEAASTPGLTRQDTPAVRLSATADAARWLLTITDNGPGIPPDIQPQIFRPYFTTKRDGNGIGLAITQQVILAHSGHIHVQSPLKSAQPGSMTGHPGTPGTCFQIVLPVNGPAGTPTQPAGLADAGQEGVSRGQDPGDRG